MKNTVFALALALPALVIGCQNDSTAPTSPQTLLPRVDFSKGNPITRIPIHTTFAEPRRFYSFLDVDGDVAYRFDISVADPAGTRPLSQSWISLTLNADAKPSGSEGPVWHISGSSRDGISASSTDGVRILEKSYTVQGRTDGLSLRVQFRIEGQTTEVSKIWLHQLTLRY